MFRTCAVDISTDRISRPRPYRTLWRTRYDALRWRHDRIRWSRPYTMLWRTRYDALMWRHDRISRPRHYSMLRRTRYDALMWRHNRISRPRHYKMLWRTRYNVTSWSDKQAQALQDAMENQVRCSDVTSWSLNLVMSELAMYHAYCIVEALHEKPNHYVFK